jgi:uncharacterized membrane protein
MPQTEFAPGVRRAVLGRRNLLVLAIAIITLVAGYALLKAGNTSLAAVLLVVGYCVLFPLAIAL